MYFNFTFPFQQLYLHLNLPYSAMRQQSDVPTLPLSFEVNEKKEQQQVIVKQEQQNHYFSSLADEDRLRTQRQTIKTEKKQEKSSSFINPPPKRKRQLDSFTQRRNILPNNINHILAFIQRKSKSEHLVRRIIQKQNASTRFTAKRYYCYQTYLKQKLHIHVNKDTLSLIANHLELNQEIFSVEEQLLYNRICRILICYYIRQLAKLKILSSSRVKCTNKLDHLKAHRTLFQYLMGNYDIE